MSIRFTATTRISSATTTTGRRSVARTVRATRPRSTTTGGAGSAAIEAADTGPSPCCLGAWGARNRAGWRFVATWPARGAASRWVVRHRRERAGVAHPGRAVRDPVFERRSFRCVGGASVREVQDGSARQARPDGRGGRQCLRTTSSTTARSIASAFSGVTQPGTAAAQWSSRRGSVRGRSACSTPSAKSVCGVTLTSVRLTSSAGASGSSCSSTASGTT